MTSGIGRWRDGPTLSKSQPDCPSIDIGWTHRHIHAYTHTSILSLSLSLCYLTLLYPASMTRLHHMACSATPLCDVCLGRKGVQLNHTCSCSLHIIIIAFSSSSSFPKAAHIYGGQGQGQSQEAPLCPVLSCPACPALVRVRVRPCPCWEKTRIFNTSLPIQRLFNF